MKRCLTTCLGLAWYVTITPTLNADQPRFSRPVETTVSVSVGNKDVTARLWMGRTQVTEPSGTRRDVDTIAIYLPDSKQLWWTLEAAVFTLNLQPLEEWKRRVRCGATEAAVVCFWASRGLIHARQISAKAAGSHIPEAVGQILANLSADSLQRELSRPFETIKVASIKELEPFRNEPGNVSASWLPNYLVTKVVPTQGGWEVYMQESGFGQVAAVLLDSSLHPISARMIKTHQ